MLIFVRNLLKTTHIEKHEYFPATSCCDVLAFLHVLLIVTFSNIHFEIICTHDVHVRPGFVSAIRRLILTSACT